MDTAGLVKKLRYLKGISKVIPEAADTIERLQKELDVANKDFNSMRDQRDAAREEVERLKAKVNRLAKAYNFMESIR